MALVERTTDLGYQGVDCAGIITSAIASKLSSIGMTFVCRYFNWKLSKLEAEVIHNAGLALLLIHERSGDDMLRGASAGRECAQESLRRAAEIGVPDGACIYYTADFDAYSQHYDKIEAYLKAATNALGGKYRTGLYASAGVIEEMVKRDAADCYWQAASQGWNNNTKLSTFADVYQYAAEMEPAAKKVASQVGVNVDLDTCASLTDAGMWMPDGTVGSSKGSRFTQAVQKLSRELQNRSIKAVASDVFIPRTVAPYADETWWKTGQNPCVSRMNGTVLPNCFTGNTQFITNQGVITLRQGFDLSMIGHTFEVPTVDGEWRTATVKYFGIQRIYKVQFENSTYYCTINHRWIIKTGRKYSVVPTHKLKKSMKIPYRMCNTASHTHLVSIEDTGRDEGVYCVVEPETLSFTLSGGEITGNCVGYAYGRFAEIYGKFHPDLPISDPNDWMTEIKNKKTDLTWGNAPKLGAIAVWKKHDTRSKGHVAVVEYINSDGSVMFSESGFNGNWNLRFWNSGPRSGPSWYNDGTFSFQGFIYNPGTENVTKVAPYEASVSYGDLIPENYERYSDICAKYLLSTSSELFQKYAPVAITEDGEEQFVVGDLHPARKLVQQALAHLGKGSHEWVMEVTKVAKNQGWSAATVCAAASKCDFEHKLFPEATYSCSDLGKELVEKFGAKYMKGGAQGGSETPQTGDIFSVYKGNWDAKTTYSSTRVGIVREVQGDKVLTVEGDLNGSILLYQRRLQDLYWIIRPNWTQEGATEECRSLLAPLIYDKFSTKEDMTLREVAFISDKGEPSIKSGIKLSAINYTTTLDYLMTFYAMNKEVESNGGQQLELKSSDSAKSYTDSTGCTIDSSELQPPVVKTTFDYFFDKGMNVAQVVGLLANIKAESNFNTGAYNPMLEAYGLCQWKESRATGMRASCGADWRHNLSSQLDFIWTELNGSKSIVLNALRTEVTENTLSAAHRAAEIICQRYIVAENYESKLVTRKNYASEYWFKISIIDNTTGMNPIAALGNDIHTENNIKLTVGEMIVIPTWVQQYGICASVANPSYELNFVNWPGTSAQRKLANVWNRQGRQTLYGIALVDGYLACRCTATIGQVGDLISVVLDSGAFFNAIIVDNKSKDEASKGIGNEYGTVIEGRKVDIIEWETASVSNQVLTSSLQQAGWYGHKISKIVNYGSWLDR